MIRSHRFTILGLVCAVLTTILIYWPGVHGGWALDDYGNIVNNTQIHIHHLNWSTLISAAFSSDSGPLHRPISMVSFALNEYFFGASPYSMKITNIAIHAFNGLWVFLLVFLMLHTWKTRFRPDLSATSIYGGAFIVATAWMWLPINLTSVLYVVQRMTSLSATFVLIGLCLYVYGRQRMLTNDRGQWLLWTGLVIGGGLAVFTKEDGALLPMYMLIIEWILFNFSGYHTRYDRRLIVFFLLGLILPGILGLAWLWPGIVTSFYHSNRPFTMAQRLMTEPRIIWDYVYWSLIPNPNVLSLYHDDYRISTGWLSPITTIIAILGWIGMIGLAITQRRKRPLVSLGTLWFLGGQLMTGTIFNLELVFEHRNYLPDLGLLVALFPTVLFEQPREKLRLVRYTLIGSLIVLYGIILELRVQTWSSPTRFAFMSATLHPHSPRATYDLGRLLAILAIEHPHHHDFYHTATKALEHASKIRNANLLPDQALLIMNIRLHHPIKHQWFDQMYHIVANRSLSAQDLQAIRALTNCQMNKNCRFPLQPMQKLYTLALKHNPNYPSLITLYANWLLNVRHQPLQALKLMNKAQAIDPHSATYRINLIKLNIALYRFPQARAGIIELAPLNHFGHLDNTIHNLKLQLLHAELKLRHRIQKLREKSSAKKLETHAVTSHA